MCSVATFTIILVRRLIYQKHAMWRMQRSASVVFFPVATVLEMCVHASVHGRTDHMTLIE